MKLNFLVVDFGFERSDIFFPVSDGFLKIFLDIPLIVEITIEFFFRLIRLNFRFLMKFFLSFLLTLKGCINALKLFFLVFDSLFVFECLLLQFEFMNIFLLSALSLCLLNHSFYFLTMKIFKLSNFSFLKLS